MESNVSRDVNDDEDEKIDYNTIGVHRSVNTHWHDVDVYVESSSSN